MPFFDKALSLHIEFTKKELNFIPIWIKLLGLDFMFWCSISFRKIRSLIRNPLMVDKNIENKHSLILLES